MQGTPTLELLSLGRAETGELLLSTRLARGSPHTRIPLSRISKGKGGKGGKSAGGSAGGNAYSGAAGQASGGNIYDAGGIELLNINSGKSSGLCGASWTNCFYLGNAGDAGSATSGASFAGNAGKIIG